MTMRRFTVMGFTEAELGFVLAAVFAALAVSAMTPQQSQANLAAKNDTLARKYDSVSTAFASYRDSVRKRSNKTPRCSEKGESADPIADVRILGRNTYELRGERLTLRDLEARLAPQLDRSNALGCHYVV